MPHPTAGSGRSECRHCDSPARAVARTKAVAPRPGRTRSHLGGSSSAAPRPLTVASISCPAGRPLAQGSPRASEQASRDLRAPLPLRLAEQHRGPLGRLPRGIDLRTAGSMQQPASALRRLVVVRSAIDMLRFPLRRRERKSGPERTPGESKFSMAGPRSASGPPMTQIASGTARGRSGSLNTEAPASNHPRVMFGRLMAPIDATASRSAS